MANSKDLLEGAIYAHMLELIESERIPLNDYRRLPKRKGAYIIRKGDEFVYAGSTTNAKTGLYGRGCDHRRTYAKSADYHADDLTIQVGEFRTASRAVEDMMIEQLKPTLQNSGVGSHGQGSTRATQKPSKWQEGLDAKAPTKILPFKRNP